MVYVHDNESWFFNALAAAVVVVGVVIAVRSARVRRGLAGGTRWIRREVDLRRDTLRFIVVTSLASGVAFEVARLVGLSSPVTSAIAALLSLQLTSYATLRVGLSRVVAVGAGIGVALVGYDVVGAGLVSVVAVVAVSLVVGKILGMDADLVRTVPAMCLSELALGKALGARTVGAYIAETLLGVAIGVLASSFTHRASALERASEALSGLAREIADILLVVGEGTRATWTSEDAAGWLVRARDLSTHADAAETLVEDAVDHAKWALRAAERNVEGLVNLMAVLRLSTSQIAGIARSLFDHAGEEGALHELGLDVALRRTGRAFAVAADVESGEATNADLERALEAARDHTDELVQDLAGAEDPTVVVAGGAVLSDLGRLVDQLDGSAAVLSLDEGAA